MEAIHRQHQRSELREAFRQDNEKAQRDNAGIERFQVAYIHWLNARIDD